MRFSVMVFFIFGFLDEMTTCFGLTTYTFRLQYCDLYNRDFRGIELVLFGSIRLKTGPLSIVQC